MVVVTTPTGQIGRKVVTGLLNQGEPVRIIARDPDKIPASVRDRVEVVTGSHRDPEVLDRALAGTEALFWVMPAERSATSIYDAYVTASIPGAEAVHRHGVRRVVIVSALGRGSGLYAGHISASLAMEDLFRSTGVHVRALANSTFMDNVLRQLVFIEKGVLPGNVPRDLKLPAVATHDIAAVAVDLLCDDAWTGQESIGVLGPEELSLNDMAAIMSDVLGWPVRHEPSDRDADKQMLLDYGFSEAVAQAMQDMEIAKERGIDSTPADTVAHTPTTFREFVASVLKPALAASGA